VSGQPHNLSGVGKFNSKYVKDSMKRKKTQQCGMYQTDLGQVMPRDIEVRSRHNVQASGVGKFDGKYVKDSRERNKTEQWGMHGRVTQLSQ